MSDAKRPYDARRRRERATEERQATRRRVVEAARELFLSRGYVATTMADIAREAGVALQSVYTAGQSKADLLHLVTDLAVAGDDQEVMLVDRPEYVAVSAESDPARQVQMLASLTVGDDGTARARLDRLPRGRSRRPEGRFQSRRGPSPPARDLRDDDPHDPRAPAASPLRAERRHHVGHRQHRRSPPPTHRARMGLRAVRPMAQRHARRSTRPAPRPDCRARPPPSNRARGGWRIEIMARMSWGRAANWIDQDECCVPHNARWS